MIVLTLCLSVSMVSAFESIDHLWLTNTILVTLDKTMIIVMALHRVSHITIQRSKFGSGVPVKGRREYVHVETLCQLHAGKAFAIATDGVY